MDIYVHPGINKEGIQRKQIVGREGRNEQTLSFLMKWCVVSGLATSLIVARNQGKR